VKIIIDANIVFSGILNLNSKIGDLIINSQQFFDFIAPEFLQKEIRAKYNKLCALTGLEITEIMYLEDFLYSQITFVPEKNVAEANWDFAIDITKDIDTDDAPYVAYAAEFDCKLWSGDKKLIKGLTASGFLKTISTDELFELRNRLSN
jgi:predicted nucleic acid-binding protein